MTTPQTLDRDVVQGSIQDPARLAALRALCRREMPGGPALDRLTRLAAHLLGAPVALISLVEADRQILCSAIGPNPSYRQGAEMPLDYSFCQYSVAAGEPFIVGDAEQHPQVAANLAVTENGVRSYAGIPLKAGIHSLGTLCVVDFERREWTPTQIDILRDLAGAVTDELSLRAALAAAERRAEASYSAGQLQAVQYVTDAAIANLQLDELLRELLARVRNVLSVDTATVLLIDDSGSHLDTFASSGLEEAVREQQPIALGDGISGAIAVSAQPMIVPDTATADVVSSAVRENIKSLMGAPLIVNGQVIGVIHVGNRTRRDFAEDDLRLLELVAHRVALAIQNARLFEREHAARLAAEAGSRAKTEFLAIVSHELRTPLNAIGGHAALLDEGLFGPLQEKQQGALQRILKSQRSLAELIDEVLEFVSLDSGRMKFETGDVDVAAVLRELAADVADQAAARNVNVRVNGSGAVTARADAARLKRALLQVVENAIHFAPPESAVDLSAHTRDGNALITIRDQGPGIHADFRESVFEPFRQIDQSYTREHGGVGLGLAIARLLIGGMRGTIRVAETDGCTIEVVLLANQTE